MIIEGIPTIILGIAAWFGLADDPLTAKYLTSRDAELVQARIDRQAGSTESAKEFSWTDVKEAFLDWKVWLFSFAQFGVDVMLYGRLKPFAAMRKVADVYSRLCRLPSDDHPGHRPKLLSPNSPGPYNSLLRSGSHLVPRHRRHIRQTAAARHLGRDFRNCLNRRLWNAHLQRRPCCSLRWMLFSRSGHVRRHRCAACMAADEHSTVRKANHDYRYAGYDRE